MAKTSMVNREVKRKKLAKKFAAKRDALKKIINSQDGDFEEKMAAATKLHDHNVSRLPVVGPAGLVGIISRVDVLREIIRDEEPPAPDA